MDKETAATIQRHALEAAKAIGRIEQLVLNLTKGERERFANHFGDLAFALHFGILKQVYDEHPDLRIGHEEEPEVSSFLKWQDVELPAGISEAELDKAILSVLKSSWQKTAMVVTKAHDRCKEHYIPVDFEIIGARIVVLAESRRIDSAGNPAMWRHSELRLPPSQGG
jgi:hypothetical protein